MRQPLEAFLTEAGVERVGQIPVGVSSVRRLPTAWEHGPGAFVALAAPASRTGQRDTYWRFYPRSPDGEWGAAVTDEVAIFRAIACRRGEPRAELPWPSAGPTVIDWELLRRAATELADQLTLERSTAAVAAGASERSRKLRNELRAGLDGLDIDRAAELLDRLLQVRVEDYDGRTGWSRFDDARRRLRRAATLGERREAGEAAVATGLDLLGAPATDDPEIQESLDVTADQIRLVAYEALVQPNRTTPQAEAAITADRLFDQPGD